jgi:hypothetical protein
VLGLGRRVRQSSSPAGFFARLGCTRMGSPGIIGVQTAEALFKRAYPQVNDERP